MYRHHTGYAGALHEKTFKHLLAHNPERIIEEAVMGMLPKNTLRKDIMSKNLKLFRGPHHTYHE